MAFLSFSVLILHLLLSSSFLSPLSVSAGQVCADDHTASLCWMCKESTLMECILAAPKLDDAYKFPDLRDQVKHSCRAGAAYAQCWSVGLCCAEFCPSLNAAANLCNLATHPTIDAELYKQLHNEMRHVIYKISVDNSGVDIPKVGLYVKSFSGGSASFSSSITSSFSQVQQKSSIDQAASSAETPFYESKMQSTTSFTPSSEEPKKTTSNPTPSPEEPKKTTTNTTPVSPEPQKTTPSTNNNKNSNDNGNNKNKDNDGGLTKASLESYYSKKPQDKVAHSPTPQDKGYSHGSTHHHAKVNTKATQDCNESDEIKYQRAARSTIPNSITKRDLIARSTNPKKAYHKFIATKGWPHPKCGRDFQNVQYPTSIPETVQQVWNGGS